MNDNAQPLLLNIEDPLDRHSGRPRFRSECYEARTLIDDNGELVREMTASGPGRPVLGPCPWATCRWHVAQARPRCNGKRVRPELLPDITEWPITCVLDVTDKGPATLETVGAALGVTRERARQLEMRAMRLFEVRAGRKLEGFVEPVERKGSADELAIELRTQGNSINVISSLLAQNGHLGWTPARVTALLVSRGVLQSKRSSTQGTEQRALELLRTRSAWVSTDDVAQVLGVSWRYAAMVLKKLRDTDPPCIETRMRRHKNLPSMHRWLRDK